MTIEEKIASLPEGFQFVSLHYPLGEKHRFWAYVYPPSGENWRALAGMGATASEAVDDVLKQVATYPK